MHMHWKFEVCGDARDPLAAIVNAVVPDPYANQGSAMPPSPMAFGSAPPMPPGMDNGSASFGVQAPQGPLANRPILKALLAALLAALAGQQNLPAS